MMMGLGHLLGLGAPGSSLDLSGGMPGVASTPAFTPSGPSLKSLSGSIPTMAVRPPDVMSQFGGALQGATGGNDRYLAGMSAAQGMPAQPTGMGHLLMRIMPDLFSGTALA